MRKHSKERKKKTEKKTTKTAAVSALNFILLQAIVLVLFFSITSQTASAALTDAIAYMDKTQYTVGEVAKIIIDQPTDSSGEYGSEGYAGYEGSSEWQAPYTLRIVTPTKEYKFTGEARGPIPFVIKETGEHRLLFTQGTHGTNPSSTQEIVFQVYSQDQGQENGNTSQVTPITQVESEEDQNPPSQSSLITTDKQRYTLGETVLARIAADPDLFNAYYEYEGLVQRYIGDFHNITLKPRGIGRHYFRLRNKNNDLIEEHGFDVIYNNTTSDTTPAPDITLHTGTNITNNTTNTSQADTGSSGPTENPTKNTQTKDQTPTDQYQLPDLGPDKIRMTLDPEYADSILTLEDSQGNTGNLQLSSINIIIDNPESKYSVQNNPDSIDNILLGEIGEAEDSMDISCAGNCSVTTGMKYSSSYNSSYNSTLSSGTYDFELDLHSSAVPINRIVLSNVTIINSGGSGSPAPLTLGLEEIPQEDLNMTRIMKVSQAYAIDPTSIHFTSGTLSATASGEELWKCADWNFTQRTCEGSWQKVMKLTPGTEYTIDIGPQDPAYMETGMATINTNQSAYRPGENATITVVALDTEGYLVGGAEVHVNVTIPSNTTINATPVPDPDKGIYEFTFDQTSVSGTYIMEVSVSGNGVNNSMISTFIVSDTEPFYITRNTPVTTDPFKSEFKTTIQVFSQVPTASTSTSTSPGPGWFKYTEIIPINFSINDTGGAYVDIVNDSFLLTWNMTNATTVSYTARAPLVTPDLHELRGFINYEDENSTLRSYTEPRPWLLAVDPAYGGGADMLEVSMIALDNSTLVIGYISASDYSLNFQVIHSNGTVLVSETQVNSDVGNTLDGRIDMAAINSTHFVIDVYDSSGNNAEYYVYDRLGNQDLGATEYDGNAGREVDIGVGSLGDRVVLAWFDPNNGDDLNGEIWTYTGTQVTDEWNIDDDVNADDTVRNDVSVTGVTSTRWVAAWFDDNGDVIRASLMHQTGGLGNEVAGPVTVDGAVGTLGQVAVTALQGTQIAIVYYDGVDQDITIRGYNLSADTFASTFGPTDIDGDAGADARVDIEEMDVGSESYFVVSWWDSADDLLEAAIYDDSGNQVLAPFTVDSDIDDAYRLHSLAASDSLAGTTLCNGTFAIAYNNNSAGAVYKLYYANGTEWDGLQCGNMPPTTPTTILCDGDTNCDILVTGNVNINSSGSVDDDNDDITYHIEALLQNITTVENTTDVSFTESGSYTTSQVSTTCQDGSFNNAQAYEFWSIWTIAGSGTALVTNLWYWQFDTSLSGAESIELALYDSSRNKISVSGYATGTGSTGWINATLSTPVQITLGQNYWIGVGPSGSPTFNIARDNNADCAGYPPTGTGSYYDSSGGGLDATIPTGSQSANKYMIPGVTYVTQAAEQDGSWTTYNDVDGAYDKISNITFTVEVDSYNPSGSVAGSTSKPDLELQVYNGSAWISIGNFSLPSTYTGSGVNTTNANFTLITTQSTILTGWMDSSNQDLRIRSTGMDFYNSSAYDQVNYTNLWIEIDGQKWEEIGNHTENTTFTWYTQNISDQVCVDLRSRAIDYEGSQIFSAYYTKGACMNLTAFPPPIISSIQCNESGSGWGSCSNVAYGDTITAVRANCDSQMGGNISNVSFSLSNAQDSWTYFDVTATTNSSSTWTYDIPDLTIYDSGNFNIHVTCRENPTSEDDVDWWIPFGTYVATINYPSATSINVTRNRFFNWSSNVTCMGGECGWTVATLDPWGNSSWKYRCQLNLTESVGQDRINEPVELFGWALSSNCANILSAKENSIR
ncbi:hypothetical protein JW711_01270, partial [Candidatus Woesearchaeota archaeon]|nr:hypothetical protein [Candidatus Woesearchaeota archaeon]